MKINHKFLTINGENNPMQWDERFYTENGILKNKNLYTPEVLLLGTFNPDLMTNLADFFYGRNFFWTGFKNLFISNQIDIHTERLFHNPYDPTLNEIFNLCYKLRLTFCDLIISIFNKEDGIIIERRGKEYIHFNNIEYNPISDNDLNKLSRIHKVNWNKDEIIKYLKATPSIKKIYFTRSNRDCWTRQIDSIQRALPNVVIDCIYTPSAQGGALHKQTGIYGQGKMIPLLRHWVHNNQVGYGMLDNNWLENKGVNINNF